MAVLPILSGREVVECFESFGWQVARQRGSHIILTKENHPATLSVPDHPEVARGTLRRLIRTADLSVDEFIDPRHESNRTR
uniref:Predicted RNA binding protein YcfA, dsRBD-like fold, HicA-like mRNA interferase family n=1 Tax=Candidatus Kentrum eta TaxID=2126337 RepID=A0A450UEC7_9GAMM|nr:MAG: Predicted RNA binding protein YcfA, dsRBD-like fold, HicA-like mRNA interferase family [Candidatus Kentron sp. H]VFJ90901.1 MAG: Predicted RNA binding protein YcfA, dsRBD-like fold, HicA-like mRNA interferase family [Candidatus Kentron sp. H]VFJ97917.1 MAG: Predicted RNA binding protein YcfA, dsRBD-like fold, HicA-like mRNA interferase family [Candidatus Kentron sp. H]